MNQLSTASGRSRLWASAGLTSKAPWPTSGASAPSLPLSALPSAAVAAEAPAPGTTVAPSPAFLKCTISGASPAGTPRYISAQVSASWAAKATSSSSPGWKVGKTEVSRLFAAAAAEEDAEEAAEEEGELSSTLRRVSTPCAAPSASRPGRKHTRWSILGLSAPFKTSRT